MLCEVGSKRKSKMFHLNSIHQEEIQNLSIKKFCSTSVNCKVGTNGVSIGVDISLK